MAALREKGKEHYLGYKTGLVGTPAGMRSKKMHRTGENVKMWAWKNEITLSKTTRKGKLGSDGENERGIEESHGCIKEGRKIE